MFDTILAWYIDKQMENIMFEYLSITKTLCSIWCMTNQTESIIFSMTNQTESIIFNMVISPQTKVDLWGSWACKLVEFEATVCRCL